MFEQSCTHWVHFSLVYLECPLTFLISLVQVSKFCIKSTITGKNVPNLFSLGLRILLQHRYQCIVSLIIDYISIFAILLQQVGNQSLITSFGSNMQTRIPILTISVLLEPSQQSTFIFLQHVGLNVLASLVHLLV